MNGKRFNITTGELEDVELSPEEISALPCEADILAEKAASVRAERDSLLRSVYDVGVAMASRALRAAQTDIERDAVNEKIEELDFYAQALLDVPGQPGFPTIVNWPQPPTKEL